MSDSALTPEVFDRLRQATAKDPTVLAELCRDYLAEARATIIQLREALAANDAGVLRDRAHYLKGSSMMIGAGALSQCCATLERMGRDSDLRDAKAMLDQAVVALEAVEVELAKAIGPAVLPAEGSAA